MDDADKSNDELRRGVEQVDATRRTAEKRTKMDERTGQRNTALWAIDGFECTVAEPDLLSYTSNKRWIKEFGETLVVVVFLSFWSSPFIFVLLNCLGILDFPADPPLSPDFFSRLPWIIGAGLLGLGPLIIVCLILYTFFQDKVRGGKTPLIIDRRKNQLLYGERLICPLSDIRCVMLRRIDMLGQAVSGDSRSRYGVSIRLNDGRTIPRKLLPAPYLRYGLGPQGREVEQVVRNVADFIGAEFRLSSEYYSNGPSKGM